MIGGIRAACVRNDRLYLLMGPPGHSQVILEARGLEITYELGPRQGVTGELRLQLVQTYYRGMDDLPEEREPSGPLQIEGPR